MKKIIKYGLILTLLVAGIVYVRDVIKVDRQRDIPISQSNTMLIRTGLQQGGEPYRIKVLDEVTTVKRGGRGFVTLQGSNGESFTIKTSYIKGDNIISVRKTLTADRNGIVRFDWIVSKDTLPGDYPVIISTNGSSIRLTHKVQ